MPRLRSGLWFDLGLLGSSAGLLAVSVSLALEPLVAGVPEPPGDLLRITRPSTTTAPLLDPARLAELTALSPAAPRPAPTAPLQLLGTLTARDPAHAVALVRLNDSGRIATVRIGDTLERALIVAIEPRQLRVRRDGREELVRPAPAQPPAGGAITTIRPDHLSVPRATIEAALEDLPKLASQAFFTPDPASGFRIHRIRPGSLFAQLGLEDGDVILRLNDTPLARLAALRSLASLQDLRLVTVELIRKGRRLTRTYELRG